MMESQGERSHLVALTQLPQTKECGLETSQAWGNNSNFSKSWMFSYLIYLFLIVEVNKAVI